MIEMILAGLQTPDGDVDPVALRSLIRIAKPKIDALAKSGKVPDYVVSSVRGLESSIERWGTETEQQRQAQSGAGKPE